MAIVTVNIPDKDERALSSFVKERAGEIVATKELGGVSDTSENEEEVTHGEFFGKNVRRAINILRKR